MIGIPSRAQFIGPDESSPAPYVAVRRRAVPYDPDLGVIDGEGEEESTETADGAPTAER